MSSDDNKDGVRLTDDLDRTIEMLESEIESQADKRRELSKTPPAGAKIPVLQKKVTTVAEFPQTQSTPATDSSGPQDEGTRQDNTRYSKLKTALNRQTSRIASHENNDADRNQRGNVERG